MATGTCPRCQKPLEGQVKLCSLCSTTYHADCLRDTRDCVLCATQTSGVHKTLGGKKSKSNVFVIVLLLFIVASLIVLAIVKYTPRAPKVQTSAADQQLEASRALDTIRQGIVRFEDKHGKRFTGTSLKPLSGSFLASVPTDPWGRSYLLDADVGVVLTYGRDGKAGGEGEDADVIRYFRRPLQPVSAHYSKAKAVDGGILQIVFNKPFSIIDEEAVVKELELVEHKSDLGDESGQAIFASFPDHWVVDASSPHHAPEQACLALKSKAQAASARFLAAINPGTTAVNLVSSEGKGRGLVVRPSPQTDKMPSPCDESKFGKGASSLLRPFQPIPPQNGLPGGVTIDNKPLIKG